jgi:hypothetical protein
MYRKYINIVEAANKVVAAAITLVLLKKDLRWLFGNK